MSYCLCAMRSLVYSIISQFQDHSLYTIEPCLIFERMRILNNLYYYVIAFLICALSFSGVFYFRTGLIAYPWAFGPKVFVLFIPPLLSTSFLIIVALKQKLVARDLLISSAMFFICLSPLGKNFFQDIQYFKQDDGYRYSLCAHNMVNKKTLIGGDLLFVGNYVHNNRFVFQAGYRYFLALELILLHHENRLLQIINLFLWCVTIFELIRLLQDLFLPAFLFNMILFFVFGASLYAFKNILMGLSEWLCVLFLLLFLIFLIRKKIIPAVIFLALMVFVRQNQLPVVLLFLLLALFQKKNKALPVLVFAAVLLLPVYHNLYYDHSFAFFHDYGNYLDLIPSTTGNVIEDMLIMIRNTSVHYLGFDLYRSITSNFFGFAFIPMAMIMVVFMYKELNSLNKKVFMLCIVLCLSTSVILNHAYFPRFEFVNFFSILSGFTILWQMQLKLVDLKSSFS